MVLVACSLSLNGQEELYKTVKTCNGEELPDVIHTFTTDGSIEYNVSDTEKGFEGQYKNGVKNGTWSYYDSKGKLMEKRTHTDNYNFTSSNKTSKLSTTLVKDANGVIPFHHVKEADVAWSARYFQFIDFAKVENVDGKVLKQTLEAILIDPQMKKYGDSELKEEVLFDVSQLNDYAIVGFISKNDLFVDKARMITDQRTIGLQLVGKNVKTGQLEALPALYYPNIREALAKQMINYGKKSMSIDEVFFYNLLRGPANQITFKSPTKYYYGKAIQDLECFFFQEYSHLIFDSEKFLTTLIEKNSQSNQ